MIPRSIVTVHGICSTSKEPWIEIESHPKSKWVERSLFEGSNARVIVFGYPLGIDHHEHLKSTGIQQYAHQLLESLQEWRTSSEEVGVFPNT